MGNLIQVILPVFLVIGFGYGAAWKGLFTEIAVDGLMRFATHFAIPCLLFLAISTIDLASDFNAPLLASFYIGAFSAYGLGYLGARYLFSRTVQDSISIGFCALFSNTVLLGLPIVERAFGPDVLSGAYAIVSVHALVIYGCGVTMMEMARARKSGSRKRLVAKISGAMSTNPILIGILLGFLVNIGNIHLPDAMLAAIATMSSAALPAALFALGGVLVRYRPEGDRNTIVWVTAVSLIAHPAITFSLAKWVFMLDQAQLRAAVLTAAMAPGINAYLFATMYGTAMRVAASTVLVATALSVVSIWVWLAILS